MSRDRVELLRAQTELNGIDFVAVSADQLEIRVQFLNAEPASAALGAVITKATITGGEVVREVAVLPIAATDWSTQNGRPSLRLRVAAPGDFSIYTLRLNSDPAQAAVLDRFFDHVPFSFKASCPSTLDCETPEPACVPEADDDPPVIDYLAKDYRSFRAALLGFSALRYPEWQERSEADFGVMFLEALSNLGDELSYYQDRVAAETTLDTASQRRSLVRHARLVNYEPRPAIAARAWLRLSALAGSVPAGLPVSAQAPDGGTIDFETGTGLDDPRSYPVSPLWDAIIAYYWDDSEACLPVAATEMWLEGHGLGLQAGQLLLIETEVDAPEPPKRQIVTLAGAPEEVRDPLVDVPPGKPLTRITWRSSDALERARNLRRTLVRGNLVPATQGRRVTEVFSIGPDGPRGAGRALVRTGANGSDQVLYTLRGAQLAWLLPESGDPDALPVPEIRLVEQSAGGTRWAWYRNLLAAASGEKSFTLDPARYVALEVDRRGEPAGPIAPAEYDGAGGWTVRFGDGVFGAVPDEESVFRLVYRIANGAQGNVAADSITHIDPASGLAALASAATNPFGAVQGADQEDDASVRVRAPQAFRTGLQRAVRPEDYQTIVKRLPWVQRGGTTIRHTGSWLTVFTAVDPIGGADLPLERHAELVTVLDRHRLAGYDTYVPAPRFAALDLEVEVCARSDAFRGDVEAALRTRLSAGSLPTGELGFFHPDHFSFGQSLDRSALEAAIQGLPGVDGVRGIAYRRRGQTPGYLALPTRLFVALDEIVRVDSDPNRPERGSVRVIVQGGK